MNFIYKTDVISNDDGSIDVEFSRHPQGRPGYIKHRYEDISAASIGRLNRVDRWLGNVRIKYDRHWSDDPKFYKQEATL